MAVDEDNLIPFERAKRQVEIIARRLALLHLAYARTLVKEFGQERGRKLILKAIKDYGIMIGEKIKKGEKDRPEFGGHERIERVDVEGEKRIRIHGCILADEWKKYDDHSLGRLYCYVDPAKSMTINPVEKLIISKPFPTVTATVN